MPSLPCSSTMWKQHLLYFLGMTGDHKPVSYYSYGSPLLVLLITITTLFVCATNSLFQWLVFTSRSNYWSDITQGIPRVFTFVPFDILYAMILYINFKNIFIIPWYIVLILVAGEGTMTWLLSFVFLPCAYGVDCHSKTGQVNQYVANWNLSTNFTPHIWFWIICEILLSFITCKAHKPEQNDKESVNYVQLHELEESKSEAASPNEQNNNENKQNITYKLCMFILSINILIFMMVYIVFCGTQLICGASIWNLKFNPNLTSAKIYLVYLFACSSGKYLLKRVARFIDRYCLQINREKISNHDENNDHKIISIEVLMEIHISIIYNVIFRFLFPVIENIYEFIVLKVLHIMGDIMHNWIRRSSIYFKYSLYFQTVYLSPIKSFVVNSTVDNSNEKDWNIRVLLDCTLRYLISCCEGCVVLFLDSCLLKWILGWNLNMNAVYYTIASVIIDSIVFISARSAKTEL